MKPTLAADRGIGAARDGTLRRKDLRPAVPHELPAAPLEAQIAQAFAEVFDVDAVGLDDDFFDLGGDSLLAETLSMAISHHTGRAFEISGFLDHGTPRKIAALLASGDASASAGTERPPIFAVHGRFGFMLPEPSFLEGLAAEQRFRMFELPGIRGGEPALDGIEDIAAAYVAQLNRDYPEGPVFLAAFCTGSVIATEMCALLERMGRPVHRLVLVDPSVPNSVIRNHRRRAGPANPSQPESGGIASRLKMQLLHAGYFLLLGRWTDGSRDEDFADSKLRNLRRRQIRLQLWFRRLKGRQKTFSRYRLSNDAQARLSAAYRHHWPRRFTGPVSVLCSAERRRVFEDETGIWAYLLPRRHVLTVVDTHRDVMKGDSREAARVMQSIFDAGRAALKSQ